MQVLKAKSKSAWSGCIEIKEPQDSSISWNIYLLEGKIQYISTTEGQQERLGYLWQRYKLASDCPQVDRQDISEYAQLCQVLSDRYTDEIEVKKHLFRFCREGLVNVLGIEKAQIRLVPARRIKNAVISFSLEKLAVKLEEQVKINRYLRSYISSPFCRLYLEQKNALKFYQIWKPKYATPELKAIANTQKLSSFVSLFVAKNSLYQIATKTDVDTLFIGRHLKQSIAQKLLDLLPFRELTLEEARIEQQSKANNAQSLSADGVDNSANIDRTTSLIVCIDDSKTVQRQVKMTLEAADYRVLSILDPRLALKKLSQHQPAVIFMDINMPNLNGYDLCSLLRKSQRFKDVPIVMLTGRDGMIDRVRAKIVGATDYLTKPCDPNKLITLAKVLEKSTVDEAQNLVETN